MRGGRRRVRTKYSAASAVASTTAFVVPSDSTDATRMPVTVVMASDFPHAATNKIAATTYILLRSNNFLLLMSSQRNEMVFRRRKGREANEEQPAKLPTVGCETVGCESPAPTPDADVRRHSESLLLSRISSSSGSLLFENEAKMEQLTREGCFPSPSAPHAVHLFKLQHEFICPTSLILRTFNLRGCNLAP